MTPKISFIIPVYNVEEYLGQCLDSVLAQSYENFEAICIDDGSTDSSLNILKKYEKKDKRIKIISQKNQGVSVARNAGLDAARGEYISFVDSDDAIDAEFIKTMLTALEENPQADFAWVDVQKGSELKKCDSKKAQAKIYNHIFSHYLKRKKPKVLSSIWNKLYRRELLSNIRFPPNISIGEDLVFLYQILYVSKSAIHIPAQLYFYRYREGSAVRQKLTDKRVKDEFASAQTLLDIFQNKKMPADINKRFNQYIAKRFLYNVIKFPKEKDKENFLFWVKKYMPYLKELETKGLFQTKYLSFKNKMLYRYYRKYL